MPRTPSLDALRILVVAVRHLSFTEAASQLNLTQSAVSHRIRGLEEELGLALFKRLTRRPELTPYGRVLARRVSNAISEIDRSIMELDRSDDAAPLKVTMLPSVASHWLIPRLPRIRCRHPNLDVQVIADPRLLDLRAEGIDLAIRFCRTPHPGYAATRRRGLWAIASCRSVRLICAGNAARSIASTRCSRCRCCMIQRLTGTAATATGEPGSTITAGPMPTATPASTLARPAC
jgi:DNA-binding transcriptional LysR family regulator